MDNLIKLNIKPVITADNISPELLEQLSELMDDNYERAEHYLTESCDAPHAEHLMETIDQLDGDDILKSVRDNLVDSVDLKRYDNLINIIERNKLTDKLIIELCDYAEPVYYYGFHEPRGAVINHINICNYDYEICEELKTLIAENNIDISQFNNSDGYFRGDYVTACSEHDIWWLVINLTDEHLFNILTTLIKDNKE